MNYNEEQSHGERVLRKWAARERDVQAELAALRAQRDELAEACRKMSEWDEREKDHAIDFYARLALCDEAFSMMRAALAKLEVKP